MVFNADSYLRLIQLKTTVLLNGVRKMVNFELPWTQKFSLSHARDKTKKRKYFAMVRHPWRKGT